MRETWKSTPASITSRPATGTAPRTIGPTAATFRAVGIVAMRSTSDSWISRVSRDTPPSEMPP